jgi:Tfp pilus assembly protein PilO
LHRNHKWFLAFSGLVLVGSGVGAYFTWEKCERLDEEGSVLEGEIGGARSKMASIEALERDVIILRENVQEYVRILPSAAEVNDFYRTLNNFANESGVRITQLDPQPKRGRVQSSKVFDSAEYRLKFRSTFSEFLQFVSKLENHERFVSIAEIKVKAGDADEEEQLDISHAIDLSVVTYVYMGNDVGPGVQIAGYERKRANLIEQIAEARHDMALERFQLLANTVRRDPFVDPRMRVTAEVIEGVDLDEQRALLEQLIAQIEENDALFDLMTRAPNVMREMELRVEGLNLMAEIQAKVDDAVARGLISEPSLRREFERRVLPELARMRKRAGPEELDQPDQDRVRIEQALAQMERAFQDADYDGCVKAYEVVASLGGVTSSDPELVALQGRMENLYLAAATALDFEALELQVSGLVQYPAFESVAIVNDIVYREGEALDQDLFLMEIHEDHLVFEFRGVSLIYDL